MNSSLIKSVGATIFLKTAAIRYFHIHLQKKKKTILFLNRVFFFDLFISSNIRTIIKILFLILFMCWRGRSS